MVPRLLSLLLSRLGFSYAGGRVWRRLAGLVGAVCLGAAAQAQTAYFSASQSAVASNFSSVAGVAVDTAGNVYVADQGTEAVYKESPVGGSYLQSTVASGFSSLVGVAVDTNGNVYVADQGTETVYKETQGSGSYAQSTVASGFNSLVCVAVDTNGNVYAADHGTETVYKETPGSTYTRSTVASGFSSLAGVAADTSGNIYVADEGAATVYKETPGTSYSQTTVASGFSVLAGVAVDASSAVYAADHGTETVYKEAPNGSGSYIKTIVGSGFSSVAGVAADRNSTVYAADHGVETVFRLQAAGVNFSTVAVGTTSAAQPLTFTFTNSLAATIGTPVALTAGAQNLDFAVSGGGSCNTTTPYGVTASISCTVDVAFTPQSAGLRMGAVELTNRSGSVIATAYVYGTGSGPTVAFPPGTIALLAGDGNANDAGDDGPATQAEINYPFTTALDGSGNVYISDTYNNVVREVNARAQVITTVAGGFNYPEGIALDGAGNLYIADSGDAVVSMLTPSGALTTVAGVYTPNGGDYSGDGGLATSAQLNSPAGIAVDGAGNLYIADQVNSVIREVNHATGIITTVAGVYNANGGGYGGDGGPATSAQINDPSGVAVDGFGNLYIADTYNQRIRKVNAATGTITTVAGNGSPGYSGNGVAATSAQLNYPQEVAVDAEGNLYIADTNNNVIREVNVSTENITTVAGNTTSNYSGDNGPATSAELSYPGGLVVDGAGNLYIADSNNNRIRKVTVSGTSLSFNTTNVGSTSSDSPKTVTVENIGNASLVFQGNPSVSTNFGVANSTCNNAGSIAVYTTCAVQVDFSPVASGNPLTGTLALTDNASPATQTIALSGVAVGGSTTVTGISPAYGLLAGGTTVMITGTNFTGASKVNFGTISASSYSIKSDTLIAAVNPSVSAAQTVDVTVTVGTNTSPTSTADKFTYYTPLTVTTTIPAEILTGGTAVSFTPVTAANGIPAYSYGISPALPAGLSLNTSTGAISGTPTQAQTTIPYTVTVTDSIGESKQATFTLAISAAFGTVALGSSATQTIAIAFTASVTLGAAPYQVLTMGGANLDFTASTTQQSSVCAASQSYSSGSTCTVTVTFTPKYPGLRNGAVTLVNSSGAVIATAYFAGTGAGPQVVFGRSVAGVDLGGGYGAPDAVAVDGVGNVYVADAGKNAVKEIPVTCINGSNNASCIITLGGGFTEPEGVAVDGAGNVYVADYGNEKIKEIPAGCTSSSCVKVLGSGFLAPQGVAVDSGGNVYVADTLNNLVKEIPVTCINGSNNSSCVITLGSGFSRPFGVAVDGSGNVYVADTYNDAVKEIPVSCINGSNNSSCVITLGGGSYGQPSTLALDPAGNIYVANYSGNPEVLEIPAGCTASSYTAGSCKVATAVSGNGETYGIALDSAGNLYEGSYGFQSVVFINRNTQEGIDFDVTNVGSTSADSPEIVTVENIGNTALTVPASSSAQNPTLSTNFTLDSSNACPVVAVGASAPGTLAAGATCKLAIDFTPLSAGSLQGSLVLTDTNLNANPSTTQTIVLNGTGVATVPNPPTIGSAMPGNASATVTFTPPASNGGAAILSYTVTSSPTGITAVGTGSPITVTGLTNGTPYTFTVTATNSVGTSAPSAPSNGVTPESPLAKLTVTGYPAFAPTGVAQTVTVTAYDTTGAVYTGFTGPLTLSSTDPLFTSSFISSSNGLSTYSATLNTAGTQSITATSGTIRGSATGIVSTGYIVAISPDGPTLSKFTENGTPFSSSGYPATGAQFGAAVDAAGDVFSVSNINNNSVLVEFNNAGTPLSGTGYTGGGLNNPQQLAIDGAGQVWVVNGGNNSLSVFTNSGTPVSPANTGYISGVPAVSGAYNNPTSVSIDISGNVWVSNGKGNTVTEVLGAAAPTAPPSTALTNGTTGAKP